MNLTNDVQNYKKNNLWNLFSFLLLVDTFNGLFLATGLSIPISICYKLFIIITLVGIYISHPSNNGKIFILSLYSIILCFYFVTYIEVDSLFSSLSPYIRFVIAPLGLWYFSKVSKTAPTEALNNSIKIIYINVIIICANVLLSLVGVGYTSYSEGVGNKGFFYAANEVSAVMILLFGFYTFILRYKSTTKHLIFISTIFFIITICLGTKSAIVGYLITLMYLLLFLNQKQSKRHIFWGKVFLLSLIPTFFFIGYYFIEKIGLLEKWLFFFQKSDDILSFLLSGRNDFWIEEKGDMSIYGFWGQLLGIGNNRTVEMDPFDIYLNYGIIGLILIYSFWFSMIYKAYKLSKVNKVAKFICFLDIILICMSSFAGHVIFSGMLTPFIAIINSLIYIPDSVLNEKINRTKLIL